MGGVAKIFSPILSVLGGGEKPAAPAPIPEITEPAVMPDADDKQKKIATRRKNSAIRQRSGRLSTINTDVGTTVLG